MQNLRSKFPVLKNNKSLIYFDNAATILKPKQVIDKEINYLTKISANPHTTDYKIAFESNEIINLARHKVIKFINGNTTDEVVFTSGTTFALNQIAFGLRNHIKMGDEILITELEHSSNLLPWITLANEKNAKVRKLPLTSDFKIDLDELKKIINSKTKIVSFAHVFNTTGSKNDVKKIVSLIRKINKQIIIIVDCAQSIGHTKIDVKSWDVDFIAFSAHKMYGPFGIGVLWGKKEILDKLVPLIYGGGMSKNIDNNLIDYKLSKLPEKLEGGTPNISSIPSMIEAINFINNFGIDNIEKYETKLKKYAIQKIKENNLESFIDFYNLENNSPILLFNVKNANPQDIASFLDNKYSIAVRSGAQCARRIENIILTPIAVRASFAIYNTFKEIDKLIDGLKNSDKYLDMFF